MLYIFKRTDRTKDI